MGYLMHVSPLIFAAFGFIVPSTYATSLPFVCNSTMDDFAVGTLMWFTTECASIYPYPAGKHYELSTSPFKFDVFSSISKCRTTRRGKDVTTDKSAKPERSTVVLQDHCSEVFTNNNDTISLLMRKMTCFPDGCPRVDDCITHGRQCGAFGTHCRFDPVVGACLSVCWTISNKTHCDANPKCRSSDSECLLALDLDPFPVDGIVMVGCLCALLLIICCACVGKRFSLCRRSTKPDAHFAGLPPVALPPAVTSPTLAPLAADWAGDSAHSHQGLSAANSFTAYNTTGANRFNGHAGYGGNLSPGSPLRGGHHGFGGNIGTLAGHLSASFDATGGPLAIGASAPDGAAGYQRRTGSARAATVGAVVTTAAGASAPGALSTTVAPWIAAQHNNASAAPGTDARGRRPAPQGAYLDSIVDSIVLRGALPAEASAPTGLPG